MGIRFIPFALFGLPVLILAAPDWVPGKATPPAYAVIGGREKGLDLYICRARHLGGLHPGKFLAGRCNIEYNGGEAPKDTFEVLVEHPALVRWVPDSLGAKPADAFPVGEEKGVVLYSCRTEIFSKDSLATPLGLHPGKLIGPACNIPYGGSQHKMPVYSVLVIDGVTAARPLNPGLRRNGSGTEIFRGRLLDGRKRAPNRLQRERRTPKG